MIPLIDWRQAPDWAVAHIFQPWGEGVWGNQEPYMGIHIHNRGRWWFRQPAKWQASGYELPLGEDFRASLELRPRAQSRPLIVCLCGSTRFSEAFQQANLTETLAGNIVLSIGCDLRSDEEIFREMTPEELQETKARLDELHLRKIDLADQVLILNVGGYIGQSTRRELEYAQSLGKVIRFLEEATEGVVTP